MKERGNIILAVLLTISVMLNILMITQPAKEIEKTVEIVKKDTIIDTKYETDTIYFPKTDYKRIVVNDTIYILDSLRTYRDSNDVYSFRADAVRLDNYNISIHKKDTVTLTETHVVEKIIKEKKRFPVQLGVYGGLGYDVKGKTFGPEVGIGIVVPLTKW